MMTEACFLLPDHLNQKLPPVKHIELKIRGKVQGVWFRKSTQLKARELGLKGFVRNETDGSVYVQAEGPSDQVDRFLSWCREGPPMARVEKVDWKEGEPAGFQNFEIKK